MLSFRRQMSTLSNKVSLSSNLLNLQTGLAEVCSKSCLNYSFIRSHISGRKSCLNSSSDRIFLVERKKKIPEDNNRSPEINAVMSTWNQTTPEKALKKKLKRVCRAKRANICWVLSTRLNYTLSPECNKEHVDALFGTAMPIGSDFRLFQ